MCSCVAAIYLHDPATMVAAVDPSLLTFAEGVVRVQYTGICKGLTVLNYTCKKYVISTFCNGSLITKSQYLMYYIVITLNLYLVVYNVISLQYMDYPHVIFASK